MLKNLLKTNLLLCVFILFALVARIIFLGTFPPGMAHDEMDMVLSSKAIAETGRDLSGEPFPTFFVRSEMEAQQTNVIPFLLSPYFKLVDVNLFSARVPFLLINFLLLVGIIKLVRLFNRDKLLSLITAFVFLASPWMFVFSRRTFAAPTSLMFLVWGIYFLYRKKESIFKSYAAFFLSTLSYMGSIVIVPPIVLVLTIHKFYLEKRKIKKRGAYLFIYLALIAAYLITSFSIKGGLINNRQVELGTEVSEEITEEVNELRRMTLEFPLKSVFVNKYTVVLGQRIPDYFNSFNVDSLLFSGDPRFTYTFDNHGLIYLVDFALIFMGLAALYRKSKKLLFIISTIAVVSALGPMASTILYSIIYRAFPLSLVFVLLSSFGLWEISKTKFKQIGIIIYFAFFINFLVFYFLQYPVRLGENFDVPERVAVNIAIREADLGHTTKIVAPIPYQVMKQVAVYSHNFDTFIIPPENEYKYGNIVVSNDCTDTGEDVIVLDQRMDCEDIEQGYDVIHQQKDAGYRYKIFGSSICDSNTLDKYKRFHETKDYKIELLSNYDFCSAWIFSTL